MNINPSLSPDSKSIPTPPIVIYYSFISLCLYHSLSHFSSLFKYFMSFFSIHRCNSRPIDISPPPSPPPLSLSLSFSSLSLFLSIYLSLTSPSSPHPVLHVQPPPPCHTRPPGTLGTSRRDSCLYVYSSYLTSPYSPERGNTALALQKP